MSAPQQRTRGGAMRQSLGAALTARVKSSRVLLVGAGGIGCELLKNLVCCGFGSGHDSPPGEAHVGREESATNGSASVRKAEIVVVDLDTIDLSNLNRQFLFRKQHIKKPKASIAKETASHFNPSVNIEAHHASILDNVYDVEFFEGFDVVFNALDNMPARRHVNRMCLAANVPLVESGTTGYNGQVQVIKKGLTECYDCNEKPVQKSFPICTIRSTPSQPIHCIVWAKSYLLPELFGASEDEEMSEMTVTEGDNAEELAKLKLEAQALKKIRSLIGKSEFAAEVFNKVFYEDIERLRSMEDMWKTRKAPDSLRFESVCIDKNPESHGEQIAKRDQYPWSLLDNLKVFCYSIQALSKRSLAGESEIEFDKDDKDTLDFVASSANLRSHIFGIPVSSEWDIKQMAGNIIPAIATSNAITASLCVLQGFKILRHDVAKANGVSHPTAHNHLPTDAQSSGKADMSLSGCKFVFLRSNNAEWLLNSEPLRPSQSHCPVCSPYYAKVVIPQGSSPTLEQLVSVLKERVGYDEFSLVVGSSMIYDPDLEDNLPKPLKDLGIDGFSTQFITVTDSSDEPKIDLVLSVKMKEMQGDSLELLPASIELPSKPAGPTQTESEATTSAHVERESELTGSKRKRSSEEETESALKRTKLDDEAVMVEDEGAIEIEDD